MAGLTDAKIAGLKPPERGQVEHSDDLVPGLRVRIGTSGTKTFILRKRVAGRLRNIAIGRYGPRLSLKEARARARAIVNDIESGGDPLPGLRQERRDGATAGTVRALWQQWMDAEVVGRLRSERDIARLFERFVAPAIGDRLADSVTRGEITRLVDDTARASGAVTARHVHAWLSSFYSWALPRLDRLPSNPCRSAGRPPAPAARDRVLSDAELRALWRASDAEPYPWRAAVKLLILTAQRRSEVIEARWDEIDLDARLWTIPAGRAKNGKAHLVPLSAPALDVIRGIPRLSGSGLLFPSRSDLARAASGLSKLMARLAVAVEAEMGEPVERWTLHDLRRTAATGMQRLGIRLEVTEATLNHVSGSRAGIVGVYQRHDFRDEKRHALDAWAAEVMRIVEGRPVDNVAPIRAARARKARP